MSKKAMQGTTIREAAVLEFVGRGPRREMQNDAIRYGRWRSDSTPIFGRAYAAGQLTFARTDTRLRYRAMPASFTSS